MANPRPEAIYRYEFTIPPEAVDGNGHVNNVAFVQWMQEAAVRHFESLGGMAPMQAAGATWVVHSHKIEYLKPAFAGQVLEVRTWVSDVRRVRSTRHYEFVRKADGELLVKGETDWVFVDAGSGRPKTIPEAVTRVFPILKGKM